MVVGVGWPRCGGRRSSGLRRSCPPLRAAVALGSAPVPKGAAPFARRPAHPTCGDPAVGACPRCVIRVVRLRCVSGTALAACVWLSRCGVASRCEGILTVRYRDDPCRVCVAFSPLGAGPRARVRVVPLWGGFLLWGRAYGALVARPLPRVCGFLAAGRGRAPCPGGAPWGARVVHGAGASVRGFSVVKATPHAGRGPTGGPEDELSVRELPYGDRLLPLMWHRPDPSPRAQPSSL